MSLNFEINIYKIPLNIQTRIISIFKYIIITKLYFKKVEFIIKFIYIYIAYTLCGFIT